MMTSFPSDQWKSQKVVPYYKFSKSVLTIYLISSPPAADEDPLNASQK